MRTNRASTLRSIIGRSILTLILSVLLAIRIAPALSSTAFAVPTRTAIPIANQKCSTFSEYTDIVNAYKTQGVEAEARETAKKDAKTHFTNELSRDDQYDVIACTLKSGQFHLFMVPYMIRYFVEVIIQLAGLVCVLFIVIGAYQYLIGSLTEDKQKGKDTIKNALIGLVITLLSWIIVNVVQVALTGA
ncbi:MAG: pilin [Candidatus Peregrinibacteria bacterium]|nr:pilin [Candidatus Peregrinibacteria bacterium]MDZ4245111.1 pilin [Candidatus Gracilibacteria bacterium]